jgi:hypothetical protein
VGRQISIFLIECWLFGFKPLALRLKKMNVDVDSGDSGVALPEPRPKRTRVRKAPEFVIQGAFALYIIIASADGWGLRSLKYPNDIDVDSVDWSNGNHFVYGIAVGRWKLQAAHTAADDWTAKLRRIACRSKSAVGFLEYECETFIETANCWTENPYNRMDTAVQVLTKLMDVGFLECGEHGIFGSPMSLRKWLEFWTNKYDMDFWWTSSLHFAALPMCLHMSSGGQSLFHVVALRSQRAPRQHQILGFFQSFCR